MSGLKTLQRIAAKQSSEAPPAGEKKHVDRPVLRIDSVLDRLWRFMKNTFQSRSIEDQLKEDKAVMAAAFEEAFLDRCRDDKQWFTSADIAGGLVMDPETGAPIEIQTGDVQWQEQLKTLDVEAGSANDKRLSTAARGLMPEYARLELKDIHGDAELLDAMVHDLGPERIARWFTVKTYRRALTGEQARELYFKNAAGRKIVESMIAAGAVKLVGFAKVMRDPRAP